MKSAWVKSSGQCTDKESMFRHAFVRSILCTLTLLISAAASAQIDPASGLLLGSGASQDAATRANSVDSGLGSGRYTTRKKTQTSIRKKASSVVIVTTPAATPSPGPLSGPVVIPSVLVDIPDAKPVAAPVVVVPVAVAQPAAQAVPVATPVGVAPTAVAPRPVVFVPAAIDRRWDLLDINVAPAYSLQDSKSRFTYRNYQFSAPGVMLTADTWLAPSLGFHASFFSTLSGSLTDAPDGSSSVWATQQNFAIGARWRHPTSDSTLAPTLTFGGDWESDQMKVPAHSLLRQHLRTDGVVISGGVEVPSSAHYAWTTELSIMPLADQTERSGTINISSGTHSDSSIFGLAVGGRYAFDHTNSIYWKLTGRYQKDIYDGRATPSDPLTGQTLSGVTVTTKSLLLELGFSFGN
jgi:hypothetical protein